MMNLNSKRNNQDQVIYNPYFSKLQHECLLPEIAILQIWIDNLKSISPMLYISKPIPDLVEEPGRYQFYIRLVVPLDITIGFEKPRKIKHD
jgi:hypothetical protein